MMKRFFAFFLCLLLLTSSAALAQTRSLASLLAGKGYENTMALPDLSAVMGATPEAQGMDSFGIGGALYTGYLYGYAFSDEAAANAACQAFHDAMAALPYDASAVEDDTCEGLLYGGADGAFVLLFREKEAPSYVGVLTQDGTYSGMKVATPRLNAAEVYPVGETLGKDCTRLGTLALVMDNDGTALCGQAVRYHIAEAYDRTITALGNGLDMMTLYGLAQMNDETYHGLNYVYLAQQDAVLMALILDAAGQNVTVLYNEKLTYTHMMASDSFLPNAPDAQRKIATETPPTEAPKREGVTLNGQIAEGQVLYSTADDSLLGTVQLLCVVVKIAENEAHLVNVMLPADGFVSGAALTLTQMQGTTTVPLLQLETFTAQSHGVYLAGQQNSPFKEASVAFPAVSRGESVRYDVAVSYELNGKRYDITALGTAAWQELGGNDAPQDNNAGTGICAMCNGSGNCHQCGGAGKIYTYNSSVGDSGWMACTACDGAGVCPWCKGAGYGGLYAQ